MMKKVKRVMKIVLIILFEHITLLSTIIASTFIIIKSQIIM